MLDNLFQLFTGKKQEPFQPASDYNLMAVDIHSHLIPGIDDGSPTMSTTLEMLHEFSLLGFKKIITSPHVVTDGYNNSSQTIIEGRDKVRAAMAEQGLSIGFDAIAEYYLDETIIEKIERKDLLTFGKNYLLVELSYLQKASNIYDLFYRLQVAGYRLVLAHPERYPYFHEANFRTYHELKDRDILFQVNISSLSGKYGKGAQTTAERMIDEDMVDFLGSDLHKLTQFENLRQCLSLRHLNKLLQSPKLRNSTLL